MKQKVIALAVVSGILVCGIVLVISLNNPNQKEWSNGELAKVFHENEDSFRIVAEYFEQQDKGFGVDLGQTDISKNEKSRVLPKDVIRALGDLQKIEPGISSVYVGDRGVNFECGSVRKGCFGSYVYVFPDYLKSKDLYMFQKISYRWYLGVFGAV